MFLVFGEKLKYRSLGRVADFCYFCRVLRACRVIRVGLAHTVNAIAFFSDGKPVGFRIQCESCGGKWAGDADHYDAISSNKRKSADELVAETHSNFLQCRKERLEIELAITRHRPLGEWQRRQLIAEPFELLSEEVELRAASTHLDRTSGLFLAFLTIAFFAFPIIAGQFKAETETGEWILLWDLAGAGAGLVLLIFLLATDVRRFIRRRIVPLVARALAPLEPTENDIQEALDRLRSSGRRIGSKISPEQIRRAITDLSRTTPSGAWNSH